MSHGRSILILFAHPALQKSRVNLPLLRAIAGLDGVTFHDLYETYPDFLIDVSREQDLLIAHDIIVFQHPFYWYSCPALLKEWIDLVLEYGFAFGSHGLALKGKCLMQAITMGGGNESYGPNGMNRYTVRELLTPFEQTARLCHMQYLAPFVVQGTHQHCDAHDVQPCAEDFRELLVGLRDETISTEQLVSPAFANEALSQRRLPQAP